MLLLIASLHWLQQRGFYVRETRQGVTFWAAMYIPVVVAMAATQNAIVAVRSGPVALLSAAATVITCFCFVALINRLTAGGASGADAFTATDAGDPS
jgi:malonate transporter MadL subunit